MALEAYSGCESMRNSKDTVNSDTTSSTSNLASFESISKSNMSTSSSSESTRYHSTDPNEEQSSVHHILRLKEMNYELSDFETLQMAFDQIVEFTLNTVSASMTRSTSSSTQGHSSLLNQCLERLSEPTTKAKLR